MSGALIRNGYTDAIRVLEPVVGASKAYLSIPVPDTTSKIRRSGVVGLREKALTIDEVISLEARGAVTIGGMFFALVRNNDADIVGVEDPSF